MPSRKENGEYVELSEDKITESYEIIRGFIPDFNYDIYRDKIHKLSKLKTWYMNSKSNIDKLSIIRIIIMNEKTIEDNDENKTFLDFITETYHIENNELVSLDDEKFDTIPSYIMNKCDDIINE